MTDSVNSSSTPQDITLLTPPPFAQLIIPKVQVLHPGIVLLKSALDVASQLWLLEYASDPRILSLPDFWQEFEGKPARGRCYNHLSHFSNAEAIRQLCLSLVEAARQADSALPEMQPTHLLLLHYLTHHGMNWHQDCDPNDGDNDHPIVSMSLGNSCVFGYKLPGCKPVEILLESGDVLIWGGEQRMLLHCVHRVIPDSVPDFLPLKDTRINFTYRDAPSVQGLEANYHMVD